MIQESEKEQRKWLGKVFGCFSSKRDKNNNKINKNNNDQTEKPLKSGIHELKQLSKANMSRDSEMFHTIDHVDAVADFMQKALTNMRFRTLDDTMLGSKEDFDRIMISAAYMHDVCHPAGKASERIRIEKLASEIHDNSYNVSDVSDVSFGSVHRRSMEIIKSINNITSDITNAKLEALHALVGVHYASGPMMFTVYQKQFMMCMILATDLCSYSDIASMDMIMPTVNDIGKVLIRCSDLSHFTMSWKYHLLWVKRLCKELSIDISPRKQVEFIDKFVLPHFKALHCFLRSQDTIDWIASINSNRRVWETMNQIPLKQMFECDVQEELKE